MGLRPKLTESTMKPNQLNVVLTEPNLLNLDTSAPSLLNVVTMKPNQLNVVQTEPNLLNVDTSAPSLLNMVTMKPNLLNFEVSTPNLLNMDSTKQYALNATTDEMDVLIQPETVSNPVQVSVTDVTIPSRKQPTYSENPENFITKKFQESVRQHHSEFFIPTESLFFYERVYYSKTRCFTPVLYSEDKIVQCACGVLSCKVKRKNCISSCGFCHLPMRLKCVHGGKQGCCRKCFLGIYDKEKSKVTKIPAPESSVLTSLIKKN